MAKLTVSILCHWAGTSSLIACLCLAASPAARAAESQGFVVSWFGVSTYYDGSVDCPDGLNPSSGEFFERELLRLGFSKEEVDRELRATAAAGADDDTPARLALATRGAGHRNVYADPSSAPDPGLKTVRGKFAFGFDLDGRPDSPISFVDPETGEKGIKNQLYRAVGCIRGFRAPPPSKSVVTQANWEQILDLSPAWLIEIRGAADPVNSDHVEVHFFKATARVMRDAVGNVKRDVSFTDDELRRSHNILRGTIRNGVLTTEPADIDMVTNPYLCPEFHWTHAQLRLKFRPDGSLSGIIGGYRDWRHVYWDYGEGGRIVEVNRSIDLPGLYYALQRMADADPDPKTGENRSISTAYEIEAVPAFIIHPGSPPKQTPSITARAASPLSANSTE